MSTTEITPGTCPLPPSGWFCKREDGHDGPCPTVPIAELVDVKVSVAARALNEAYNLGAVEWHELRPTERAAFTAAAENIVGRLGDHANGCTWSVVPGTRGLRSMPQVVCDLCGEVSWLAGTGEIL